MQFYRNERLGLFLDGPNLFAAARTLGFMIDYGSLLRLFRNSGQLIRVNYYLPIADDFATSPLRGVSDWLQYNGYTVITKPAKDYVDANGRRKIKSGMDIELAVDALSLANSLDHIVLFSGLGDFCGLVSALQRKGRRVTVVSTIRTQPPIVADDLRRMADQFIDLADLAPMIGRAPAA
ncbi:NYN domain-containing protein [Rhodomicrobium vannielii ATCC 17100]|uniref:NYN domain-containing protein n=1 Tax=Rhodomicrobium udaipurense TaxID=1202716 RepID=A0A8I1GGS2_9HYPH|nr:MULTISPECIES: NYN domain-containing protein [Rhodomicrobium]KAI96425.1 LabA-like protein [Rhodomicrobium udaipurense JA643]MBJ7534624.1 NYN domain-containing protein [Rhodomicrobium vannielii ATCC 17100]MBJ7544559.1 NYN domain-containing protein [Rhodomicrobium udaipurense]